MPLHRAVTVTLAASTCLITVATPAVASRPVSASGGVISGTVLQGLVDGNLYSPAFKVDFSGQRAIACPQDEAEPCATQFSVALPSVRLVSPATVSYAIPGVRPGVYNVFVFRDENGDGRLNCERFDGGPYPIGVQCTEPISFGVSGVRPPATGVRLDVNGSDV